MKEIECPVCKKLFPLKTNLKYRVINDPKFLKLASDLMYYQNALDEIYNATLVICPHCQNEFSTPHYRYFGFLKAKHLHIGLIIVLCLGVFAPLFAVLWVYLSK